MKLRNEVCIVTGAASGIGREIAVRFAQEGAKVAIADLNKAQAQAAADEIKGLGLAMDVTSEEQVNRGVAEVVSRWGGVDVLLNNAGTSQAAAFLDVTEETWTYDWDLKVMGAIRFCRLVVPSMKPALRSSVS